MEGYEKLGEFLSEQSNKLKASGEIELIKLWQRKEPLIRSVMEIFSNTLEAYCNKKKSSFANELEVINNLMNDAGETTSIDKSDFNSEIFNEDYLIIVSKQMLSHDYNPKELDCFDQRNHLWVLWFLYKMMPLIIKGPIPLEILMRLDASMADLIITTSQLVAALNYEGDHFDFEQKRYEAIRKAKGKNKNQAIILEAYNLINKTGKTRHKIATEIRNELGKKLKNPPSIDSIKRRLKEAKFFPFFEQT